MRQVRAVSSGDDVAHQGREGTDGVEAGNAHPRKAHGVRGGDAWSEPQHLVDPLLGVQQRVVPVQGSLWLQREVGAATATAGAASVVAGVGVPAAFPGREVVPAVLPGTGQPGAAWAGIGEEDAVAKADKGPVQIPTQQPPPAGLGKTAGAPAGPGSPGPALPAVFGSTWAG